MDEHMTFVRWTLIAIYGGGSLVAIALSWACGC